MRRRCAILSVTVLAALVLAAPAAADPSPGPVAYRPPVAGPVLDPYRPPTTPYGPGNRGIDYATTPGEPVGATADGVVTFAGSVGGGLHVVVLHADGIRTSLSFLAAVLVRRGQEVAAGQVVGRAGASVHLGARRGEAYLDPASLFAGVPAGGRAFLVPDGPGRPLGVADEAAGLRRLLTGGPPAAGPMPASASAPVGRPSPPPPAAGRVRGMGAAATAGAPPVGLLVLAAATRRRRRRGRPPAAPDPARVVGAGP